MKVYVASFDRQNYEWSTCRERGTVATMNGIDAQKFWEANDREGYVATRMAKDTNAAGKKQTKATASCWFNLMTTVTETVGDIWVHKDGSELWWTTSRSDAPSFGTKQEPIKRGRDVVICHKLCEPWSNKSKKDVPLRWNELHPKAKDFLSTDPAMFASLDRIDSSGHYAPGNLQVVCRFANFWKGASDNVEFRRLIEVIRSSVSI